jgi:hypothetical protein
MSAEGHTKPSIYVPLEWWINKEETPCCYWCLKVPQRYTS